MKFFRPILILVLLLNLSSCKDSLTIQPDNRTVADGYYDSAQKVEQAVIGGYVDLRRALLANHAFLMYGEARTGDLKVAVDFQQIVSDQKLTADQRYVKQISDWGYFYDVIRDANNLLDIISKADNKVLNAYQRNLFKGEALALKSISYFYLARIWSDIPSAEKNDFGKVFTNKQAVILASNFAGEAKAILPWMLINDDGIESLALTRVRFNKTAVTSLLAQEQLWLGKAGDAYTLLTNTFTASTTDSLSTFGLSLGADRRTEVPLLPLASNVVSVPLDRFNAIYPATDTRRSMYNISAGENKATLVVTEADVLELLPLREINLLLAEAAWSSSRLAEAKIYLIKAATGAAEDYSTLTQANFGDALLKERRRMLMGTGQRVFDLIRLAKVTVFIPAFTAADVQKGAAYWPLSANSLSGNSLNQNSYWLSKN
ncbi:RagB/SusD family nutrient uptake outer membrane protein [Pedobacter sp. JCM 36344]|uniref:RagB/SusD family nutrient uptake outer membrane protein n=1 Tax=Pedobacter sp. JCM 36344 TaxID=3374280 RepID=UPI00397A508B